MVIAEVAIEREIVMALKESAMRAEEVVGGFATAVKNVTVQYQGRERTTRHMLDMIRRDAISKGIEDDKIDQVDVYVKPEEQKVFYVINRSIEGCIEF